MKLSPELQVTSDLSPGEVERSKKWLMNAVSDLEKRDISLVSKYFTDDAKFECNPLGSIVGSKNLEEFYAWRYKAAEGSQLDMTISSLTVNRDQLLVVFDSEFILENGDRDCCSYTMAIYKDIDSEKVTGAVVLGGGEAVIKRCLEKAGSAPFFTQQASV
ncbi:hypothetical protein BKA70DRAFT_536143 [Coprinopsis sp. MPI-PUGE-AT-0042]|nr:hypothetical protein BKA70DRAFT_536143 [Coprinopsis sp. MPI-PUGE-AT-0042]